MTSKPSIVWLTVESTRFDHTSFSDYHRDTTPNLRRLCQKDGFQTHDHCITHGIWTKPSTASILTGTPPSRHGVGFINDTLPSELTTVPELLADVGYQTYCLSQSGKGKEAIGSTEIFHKYIDNFMPQSKLKLPLTHPDALLRHIRDVILGLPQARHTGIGVGAPFHLEMSILKDTVKEGQESEQPFFIYSHIGSPHLPYTPPPRDIPSFTDEIGLTVEEARERSQNIIPETETLETMRRNIAEGCDFSEKDWKALISMYDAELRFMDRYVGGFLNWLKLRNIDDLIIVVTADHGDLFGERGVIAHKLLLHDGLIRVPLAVHGLDVDLKRSDLVQHSDLIKTILNQANANTDQIQGIDLVTETRNYAFSQRREYDFQPLAKYDEDILNREFHHGRTTAIRSREYKLVTSRDRTALYKLSDEENNIVHRESEKASKLDNKISEWLDQTGETLQTNEQVELSDRMKQRLKDLGYR